MNRPVYRIGEKVIAREGPLMFEGVVIDLHKEETKSINRPSCLYYYLIHYPGWAKRYDIWLQEHDVFKINEESYEAMNELTSKENRGHMKRAYAIYKKKCSQIVITNGIVQYERTDGSVLQKNGAKRKYRRKKVQDDFQISDSKKFKGCKLRQSNLETLDSSFITDDLLIREENKFLSKSTSPNGCVNDNKVTPCKDSKKEKMVFYGFKPDGSCCEENIQMYLKRKSSKYQSSILDGASSDCMILDSMQDSLSTIATTNSINNIELSQKEANAQMPIFHDEYEKKSELKGVHDIVSPIITSTSSAISKKKYKRRVSKNNSLKTVLTKNTPSKFKGKANKHTSPKTNSSRKILFNVKKTRVLSCQEIFDAFTSKYMDAPFDIEKIEIEVKFDASKVHTTTTP